nr:hypothetical protein [uncultured Psychrobacter sp.]
MTTKKLMTYARVVLVVILLIYLLLVWMYFKDNVSQLTSFNLLVWFVVVPLLIFSTILLIRWRQKKREQQPEPESVKTAVDKTVLSSDSYPLFIYSSLCLPEGDSWAEIIENDNDLTLLSETLTDFDGLPMLVKPINRVITQPAFVYDDNLPARTDDNDDLLNSGNANLIDVDIDTLTLRLAALISEQLTLSEAALSVLTQHYDLIAHQDHNETNAALHAHPEWQTHYITSTHDDESMSADTPTTLMSELSIYLCVPSIADTDYLMRFVKQQLMTYGLPESLLAITLLEANSEDHSPLQFFEEQLVVLSADEAKVCLLLAADSQISEVWLDEYLNTTETLNHIPTEASTLFIFYNQAARAVLDIEGTTSVSALKITDDAEQIKRANDETISARSSQYYTRHLRKIKRLLLDNGFLLSALREDKAHSKNDPQIKTKATPPDHESTTTHSLGTKRLKILSDINPSKQPYDLAVFMTFVDSFVEKGALVNEHHLGHYMPLNLWLPSLTSLAMVIQLSYEDQHESDTKFLITQHKRCCMLWLVEDFDTSE